MENVFEGKNIDLFSLPAPHWHEGDGGRYIGSLDVTISRDPDEGGSIWMLSRHGS